MADIEEIKKRLDIVQVVSEYFPLKKSGITYKALCPFHSERTPSFTVSAERQTWHCFGCSEGGDVISFVQKIDGLDFSETLEKLAAKAGVELDQSGSPSLKARNVKTPILEVLELATRLYHTLLVQHESAEEARRYVQKRGIAPKMVEQFRLGYAPAAWHTIEQMLQKKGLPKELAWQSGLCVKKDGDKGLFDRFRDRIMFPIDDASGRIIGFTSRILQENTEQAKYLNTAESPVFKKSEALYGISFARQAIRQKNLAILVEGQMDVITSHQFGFTNTVATSGTALTLDHLRLLKRYTSTIAFAFDNDSAGLKAARAAAHFSFDLDLNPLVVAIPYGKDPDECIRHETGDWEKALKRARPAVDFFIEQALAAPENLTPIRKKTITQDILLLIRGVKNAVEQGEYVKHLAEKLGVSEQSIIKDLHKSVYVPLAEAPEAVAKKTEQNDLDLERQLIGLGLAYFDLLPELPSLHWRNSALAQVYQIFQEAQTSKQGSSWVLSKVPKAWLDRLGHIVIETMRRHEQLDSAATSLEIQDLLKRLQEHDRDDRIASNAQAIATAFTLGDKDKARQLLKSLDSDTIAKDLI